MLTIDDVSIRALRLSDSDVLLRAINNPDLVRFNAPFDPIHEQNHLEWLEETIKNQHKRFFIIEFENRSVGSVQLVDINFTHRNAEATIRLFKEDDCGKQVGTKAIKILCDYAFRDLGLVRVWLRVFADNVRAIRAYEKVGFVKEGIMNKAAFINGYFLDVIIMGKLNNDYF